MILPDVVFVPWAWLGRTRRGTGSSPACCRFRSPARAGQGDHRQRGANGREGQDGYGRSTGDRDGDGKQLGMGTNILDASLLQDKKQQDDAQSPRPSKKRMAMPRFFRKTNFTLSKSCRNAAISSA